MTNPPFMSRPSGAFGSSSISKGLPDALDEQRMRFQQRAGAQEAPAEEDDGSETDWMMTYTDMVTLLMAFFIILTAVAMAQPKPDVGTVKAAIQEKPYETASVFDGQGITPLTSGQTPELDEPQEEAEKTPQPQPTPPPSPATADNKLAAQLEQVVQQNNLTGQVQILSSGESVTVRISDKILFPSGQTNLQTDGIALVTRLSPVLGKAIAAGGSIAVEGHTDNIPISTAQYPSNWELSAARAAMVVRQLIGLGLPANKLSAVGLAETQPLKDNITPESKASNRRVELVITTRP